MRCRLFYGVLSCLSLGPLGLVTGCDSSSDTSPAFRDDAGELPSDPHDAGPGKDPDAAADELDAAIEEDASRGDAAVERPGPQLSAVADATQVTLAWPEVEGADFYDVYWDTAPGITTASNKLAAVSSPYVHSELTTDTDYFYRVVAVNAAYEVSSREITVRTYAPEGVFEKLESTLTHGRQHHTSTALPNGQVLIAGGQTSEPTSAELYDPVARSFSLTGSLGVARQEHTATLLADGRVLVVGGLGFGELQPSAELYDPESGTFSATGSMHTGRRNHAAVLLENGKVLVVGGTESQVDELYDPKSGKFTEIATTTGSIRRYVTATRLLDGKVLVAGGALDDVEGTGVDTAALYDPETNAFRATGKLSKARLGHTATLLTNGKVLLVGGFASAGSSIAFADAELYDPVTGTFSAVESVMARARGLHASVALPNGKVLVVGGFPGNALAPVAATLFNPVSEQFELTGSYPESIRAHAASSLSDGSVLVTGGNNIAGDRPSAVLFK